MNQELANTCKLGGPDVGKRYEQGLCELCLVNKFIWRMPAINTNILIAGIPGIGQLAIPHDGDLLLCGFCADHLGDDYKLAQYLLDGHMAGVEKLDRIKEPYRAAIMSAVIAGLSNSMIGVRHSTKDITN